MKIKRILLSLIIVIAVLCALWYGFSLLSPKGTSLPPDMIPTLAVGTYLHPSKPLADFSLLDTEGQVFTHASFLNHWTLLFFGYSKCPNICPSTLAIVSETWRTAFQKPSTTEPLHFIFVSLDPKRDTPQTLHAFVKGFHPSFKGLTGEESEVQKLSKSCSIYSVEEEKRIDHSATLLLINPQGRIQALFSPPHQAATLIADLKALLP